MKTRKLLLFVITAVICSQLVSSQCSNNSTSIKRHRRYIDFIPGTRVYYRFNIRPTTIPPNVIFIFSLGFKLNYPIKPKFRKRRSHVYNILDGMFEHIGVNGKACIVKSICEASNDVTPRNGMMFKIFKLVFDHKSHVRNPDHPEQTYPLTTYTKEECESAGKQCPLSLDTMVPFTDL